MSFARLSTPLPPAPLFIGDASLIDLGTGTALVANGVYLYAFETDAPIVITGAWWRMSSTATGTSDIGIYTFAGARQGHTGAVTNVAVTNNTANLISATSLAPGQYFMALCPSNGTDTYYAIATAQAPMSRMRFATNSGSGGVLPSTTGGYGSGQANFPLFSLIIQNGLV